MWRDTATIYRENDGEVERVVAENCHIEMKVEKKNTIAGSVEQRSCSFVFPGDVEVFPGDRVVAGIGPEDLSWQQVCQDQVPGITEMAYTKPCFLHGKLHHTEAGNRASG